ncbi:MAG: type II secretion system protein [Pseudolabrys sp.]|nr:type II secretion system protein [Pseudolabrys sp.]
MTYDPNFPQRDRDPDVPTPARGWTLGIGVLVVLAIIAFLAAGRQHNPNEASGPSANTTATNTPGASPLTPGPRTPAETTGSNAGGNPQTGR